MLAVGFMIQVSGQYAEANSEDMHQTAQRGHLAESSYPKVASKFVYIQRETYTALNGYTCMFFCHFTKGSKNSDFLDAPLQLGVCS